VASGQLLQVDFSVVFGVVGVIPCTKTGELLSFLVAGGESIGEFFGKTGLFWWEYFPD
jgi:hypothetical protein